MEAKPGDFAVAEGQELGHAKWNEAFVNLDFYRLVLTRAFDGEACFDVYVHAWWYLFGFIFGIGSSAV